MERERKGIKGRWTEGGREREEERVIRKRTQRNRERKMERGKREWLWTDLETDVDLELYGEGNEVGKKR